MAEKFDLNTDSDISKSSRPITVIDEINRGREYLKRIRKTHSCTKITVQPIYTTKDLCPDFYVKKIIYPDCKPKYESCRHIKHDIVNRDDLNIKEHIDLLAKPKIVPKAIVKSPYIVRKKIVCASHRIIELSRPKKRLALETCMRYQNTMDDFCIENCHRNIRDATFLPVHQAVHIIKLNRRRPIIEKQKSKRQMQQLKRKLEKSKVAEMYEMIERLYISKKDYFVNPTDEIKSECLLRLSGVVSNKLSDMLDSKDKPMRNSDKVEDQLLVQISDKTAILMNKLMDELNLAFEPETIAYHNGDEKLMLDDKQIKEDIKPLMQTSKINLQF